MILPIGYGHTANYPFTRDGYGLPIDQYPSSGGYVEPLPQYIPTLPVPSTPQSTTPPAQTPTQTTPATTAVPAVPATNESGEGTIEIDGQTLMIAGGIILAILILK